MTCVAPSGRNRCIVIAEPLNTKPKYVASTTLRVPLAWQDSTLLKGGAVQAVLATYASAP
jgi:hypothetical protein